LTSLSTPIKYVESDGKVIGMHQGAHYYTIGQRKGLNIGGHKDPLFVISTDIDNNLIFVGEGRNHPGLFRKALFIKKEEIHWIRPDLAMFIGEERDFLIRIRYRQPLQKGKLICDEKGMYIFFNNTQRGITPGQFAVWYNTDGEMIGSGTINK
jgi:tRNA-specific 2-thiouridylase